MGTVHFTLGENLGKRLTEIAQEKLIYNADPKAAVETFTKSLVGFPQDMAIRCLSGKDLKLIVVDDSIEVIDTPVENYPELDINYTIRQWINEFDEIYKIFERPLLDHTNFTKRTITIPYSVRDIILGYQDRNDDPYEYLKEFILNEMPFEIQSDSDFVRGVADLELYKMFREWKQLFLKRANVIQFAIDNHLVDGIVVSPNYFFNTIYEYERKIWQALYVGVEEPGNQDLDNYLEAAQEIDKIKELRPIEDYQKHDAIWISPDGTMYGLNGEIANMLHNTMADMLRDQGVIVADNKRQERNPYVILEESGWVKMHGNWIMFEPNPFDQPKQFMSDAQVDALKKYLNKNYGMVGKFGIQHEQVLTYKLNQMDKFAINKLFEL